MRRSKMVKQLAEGSKLAQALENGDSPIGMIGYVPIDGDRDNPPVFIRVKVLRLEVKSENINIIAVPVTGEGELVINPQCWLDSPEQMEDMRKRHKALQLAIADFRRIVKRPTYLALSRDMLQHYFKEHPDQEQPFLEHVKESYDKTVKSLSKAQFAEAVRALVCNVHGVHEDDRQDYELRAERW